MRRWDQRWEACLAMSCVRTGASRSAATRACIVRSRFRAALSAVCRWSVGCMGARRGGEQTRRLILERFYMYASSSPPEAPDGPGIRR